MKVNLEFCDYYKYPEIIKNQFREILSLCESHRVNSVILTGSAATGGLQYEFRGEELRVDSDYDILIVIDKNTAYRQLRAGLISLSSCFSKDSLSSGIDFSLIYLNQLGKLPRNIYTYDLKKKGITIAGEDVKGRLPYIDKNNIDIKSENEWIIYILWSLLSYYPLLMPDERTGYKNTEKFYRRIISKGILTLVPLLLLSEGELVTDVPEGVALIKNKYLDSKIAYFMGKEFAGLLDACLNNDSRPECIFETKVLYKKLMECINNILRYLIYKKTARDINDQKEIIKTIMGHPDYLFNDNCLKTIVKNAVSILINIKQFKDYEIVFLYSYVIKKSASLLSALLGFHRAAVSHPESIPEARRRLLIFLIKNTPYPWLVNYDFQKILFLPGAAIAE